MTLKERFAKVDDEFLKFDRVENPLSDRPDLCAFLLLARLCPDPGHDEIFLGVDVDRVNTSATDDDILLLTRCGVRYDGPSDCLAMFT